MAVYTNVARGEIESFITNFGIGDVVSFRGIPQGIENSNFLLRTTTGKYIVTIYERRVNSKDLPFFIGLMHFLAEERFHCPRPLPNTKGEYLHTLAGKPAAVITFVDGDWPRLITSNHCQQLGFAIAKFHSTAKKFGTFRKNNQALPAWRRVLLELKSRCDTIKPGLSNWLDHELFTLEKEWPSHLPSGIIHGDLFPDNVLFKNGMISAFIDFYFACNEAYAFELAICLNAWCFERNGHFNKGLSRALFAGYQSVRPLSKDELTALPLLARGAAMRFLITRLYDWFHIRDNTLAHRKDPLAFVPIIEFHQTVAGSSTYGVA